MNFSLFRRLAGAGVVGLAASAVVITHNFNGLLFSGNSSLRSTFANLQSKIQNLVAGESITIQTSRHQIEVVRTADHFEINDANQRRPLQVAPEQINVLFDHIKYTLNIEDDSNVLYKINRPEMPLDLNKLPSVCAA